jgi:hypothetical protein
MKNRRFHLIAQSLSGDVLGLTDSIENVTNGNFTVGRQGGTSFTDVISDRHDQLLSFLGR